MVSVRGFDFRVLGGMKTDKRFLAPLLILVFLSFFASSIPLVSASPDPAWGLRDFIAWDQSEHLLPDYGCKWRIEFTNGTAPRTFSGNTITLNVTIGDTYDISVSWLGSYVIHHQSWKAGSDPCEVTTKVTNVVFTAKDQDGNPLYDGPCYWNITYPVGNATTYSYHWASGTLKLGNGTYHLQVMWQGTYVTGNTTWNKNVDTSKSMDCSVVDRTFVAKDHDGGQTLLSGATRIWVMVPNGTMWCTSPANSSSFTIKKLSYEFSECTVKVRFENTTVFEETLPKSSTPVRTYEAKCDVYQYTPRLLDQEGNPYSGAEIHLQYPDGALKTLKTDGNGRVSIQQVPKGLYSIPEVIYNGRKVNQTAPFDIEGDLTDWLIQFNGLSINQTDYPKSVHLNSTFTVRAQLVYSYSGKPVKDGKVGLLGASWLEATTDASGWAKFEHLSEWQPTEPFTLFGVNDPIGLTYSVQNATVVVTWTGDLSIRALDAKGSALNHASVLVSNETGGYWKTVYTDSTGLANINGAPCQGYTIAVEWGGVEVGGTTIDLDRAEMSETISCNVYYWDIKVGNLDGTAISGASVTVYRPDGTVYGTYKTMGTGYIPQIQQIPKETYRVKVDYTGAIFGATVNLNQNLETQLLIALVSCPDVPNVGKLCYSTSSNVSSITYNGTFRELRIELSGPTGTSGSVSVFVPRTLLGNLSLTAENIHTFLDREPVAATIEDHPDGYLVIVSYTHSSHVVEVVFSDITLITTVKDSNRRVINGANVKLYREEALVKEGYTDEDGEEVFTNLATGEYEIKTFHLGVLVKTDRVTLLEDLDYRADCPVYDLTIQVFDMIPSPLPEASVTASLQDGRVILSGTTNGAGNVIFLQVPAENYKIKATYFGISGSTDVVIDRNLTIQIHIPTLYMTTAVLLLTAVGAALTLMGTYLSKRGEEKPKRGRGRPRKVRMPT